jgi:hypothetical protein
MTDDNAGSVFLSSSKETSDSTQRHSSSCPTNILSAKAKIGLPLTDDEMRLVLRDRQKKDNHNMSMSHEHEHVIICRRSFL